MKNAAVSKITACLKHLEPGEKGFIILYANMPWRGHRSERARNLNSGIAMGALEHPSRLAKDDCGDPEWFFAFEQIGRGLRLSWVIPSEIANEHIGIDRDGHSPAAPASIASCMSSIDRGFWPGRWSIPLAARISGPGSTTGAISKWPLGRKLAATFCPGLIPSRSKIERLSVIWPFAVTVSMLMM